MAQIQRRTFLAGAAGVLTAAGTLRSARAAGEPIQFGLSAPLSGPNAPVGQPQLMGAQIAVEQINAKGGVLGRTIELVVLDDKADPAQAVANSHEFASRKINLLLGPATTGTSMGVVPLLPGMNAVQMGMTTTDETITHQLYNRNYFACVENAYTRNAAVAKAIAKLYPKVTTWTGSIWDAVVGHNTWADYVSGLKRQYNNPTIIDPVYAKTGTTDFKVQISQLAQAKAGGLFVLLSGSDGITFYKQMQPFGLDKKFELLVDGAIDINLPKAMGRNISPNIWISSFWFSGALKNNKQSDDLAQEVIKRTGELPHGFVGVGHYSASLLAAAVQNAGGTDTEKVITALENINIETVKGPTRFRKEDHQIIAPTFLFSMKPKDGGSGFETNKAIEIPVDDVINPPAPGTKWIQP